MLDDEDDVLFLSGIAEGNASEPSSSTVAPPTRGRPAQRPRRSGASQSSHAVSSESTMVPRRIEDEGDVEGEASDILELARMAQGTKRRFVNRSWEHTAVARLGKAVKREERRAQTAEQLLQETQDSLLTLANRFPCVRRILRLGPSAVVKPEQLARLTFELAVRPVRAADGPAQIAAARAVCRVTEAILQLQTRFAERLIDRPILVQPGIRVVAVSFQWDETTQGMRDPGWSAAAGSNARRTHTGEIRVQTFVAHGRLAAFEWHGRGPLAVSGGDYFCRNMFVWRQTGNFLLEALLRQLPFQLENMDHLAQLGDSGDAVVLNLTRDGAAANGSVVEWVIDFLNAHPPLNLLPHSQACLLHRCAIARARVHGPTSIATALQSFCRWVKVGKNLDALVAAVTHLVQECLTIKNAPRPRKFDERAAALLQALCTGANDEYLFVTRKGERVPSGMHSDLVAFLQVVDVSLREEIDGEFGQLTHWCWVRPGSAEHRNGLRVGAPCCSCREEAVDKTLAPVLAYIAGRSWGNMAVSRWTHVPSALRRWLVCSLGACILPRALDHVRHTMEIEPTLEASLARAVAVDVEDFSSQNKLRLLRLTRVLCDSTAPRLSALSIVSCSPLDDVMYSLFGFNRQKCSLWDLMKPGASPIVQCQAHLAEMLQRWVRDAPSPWLIVGMSGVAFDDPDARMKARALVLQTSCGVLDGFELQMQAPPYNLIALTHEMPDGAKRLVADAFFAEDERCLTIFCSRLRRLCRNPAGLMDLGAKVVEAWSKNAFPTVEHSERSHALMRVDLKSSGRGRSPTASVNRCFCKQIRAAHLAMGGEGAPANTWARITVGDARPRSQSRVGGNPHMTFANHKRHAFKRERAPHRALSAAEREECEALISAEWEKVLQDLVELEAWRAMHFAEQLRRRAEAEALEDNPRGVLESSGTGFKGLWGLSQNPRDIVPTTVLVDQGLHLRSTAEQRSKVWQDPALNVRDARDRMAGIYGGWSRLVDGCAGQKKHICRRHTMDPATAVEHDRWAKALSAFTASRTSMLQDSSCLLLFVGRRGNADSVSISLLCLLVSARFSPLMQYFARCHVVADPPTHHDVYGRALPFDVEITLREPRFVGNGQAQSIDICTSDELVALLRSKADTLEIREAKYEILCHSPSLRGMRVTGYHDAVVSPVLQRQARRTGAFFSLPAELDVEDPLLPASRANSARGATEVVCDREEQEELDVLAALEVGADDIRVSGSWVPPDEVCDVCGGESESEEDGLAEAEFDKAAPPPASVPAEARAEAVETLAAVEESLVAADDVSGDTAGPSLAELVRSVEINSSGYIYATLPPWNRTRPAGRITTWPESKPMSERSVSMRCYFHTRCSLAKPRRAVQDEDLLAWLFSGTVVEDATAEARKAYGKAHLAQGRAGAFPKLSTPPAAASSAHG